ncbi:MAG: sigma-70 family RNA polymerase sigma factor [Acidobacteriota bacterium]|nr:sigma-70 family RNA polymerase sigma factor [Acidobacteriota bacterium]
MGRIIGPFEPGVHNARGASILSSDLIRRAKSGERDAFDRLVAEFGRLVLSLALRMVGHRQDAEDVAQEVFLRLFRALDGIDETRSLEPWLVRVTLNVARNRLSRGPARREEPLTSRAESRASASAGPDVSVRSADVRAALRGAVRELPTQEATVFVLRDLQGVTVATIAEALGSSQVTVRRQSTSARKKVLVWLRRHRPELVEGRAESETKIPADGFISALDERSRGRRGSK